MTAPATQQLQFSKGRAVRSGAAGFVGTTIEYYDFYVFATAAAIVFPTTFYSGVSEDFQQMAAFMTLAIGYFVRPLGGLLFGFIGDKFGRKLSLQLTLILMGVATVLVGIIPDYAAIGVLAPIMLIVLRAVQGLAVGGEWGGAVLMSTESAPERLKGFFGSMTQLGNPMGALLATGIFSVLTVNGDDFLMNGNVWFLEGGWRIPFLLSAVLILVGFWVRHSVEETAVFENQVAQSGDKFPTWTAIRFNWLQILLGIGLIPIATGGYYIVTTFATSYATGEPNNIDENLILNVLSWAAFFELISTLGIGWLSDRFGRKRVMTIGLVVTAVAVVPMFLMLNSDTSFVMLVLLFSLVRVTMNATWAPLAAIMSQLFTAQGRQSALSISYTVGNAVWAGLSPIIALALWQATGSVWSVIIFFFALTVVSLVCLQLARQVNDKVFVGDEEEIRAAR